MPNAESFTIWNYTRYTRRYSDFNWYIFSGSISETFISIFSIKCMVQSFSTKKWLNWLNESLEKRNEMRGVRLERTNSCESRPRTYCHWPDLDNIIWPWFYYLTLIYLLFSGKVSLSENGKFEKKWRVQCELRLWKKIKRSYPVLWRRVDRQRPSPLTWKQCG